MLEIELAFLRPVDYGDFYALIQNADGIEERVKVLSLQSKFCNIYSVVDI